MADFDRLTQLFRARPQREGFEEYPGVDVGGQSGATHDGDIPQAGAITHLQVEPVTDTPGGYMQPALPPGLPWIAGSGPGNPIPRDLRYPEPPKLWEKKVIICGVATEIEVGFPIQSVRIDNWTPQYLLVRGPDLYLPPYTYSAIVKMYDNPQRLSLIWEAPPGFVQPAVNAATVAHVYALEDDLVPSPGSPATPHP